MDHPQSVTYRDYGTAAMAHLCQSFAALPAHNFSRGTFDKVDNISGETLREFTLTRGKPSICLMRVWLVVRSNARCFWREDGKVIVSPLEYETIGLME